MLSDQDPSVTAHRLGSSTWFDFGSPTCRSLTGFGKYPTENNSARRLQAKQTQAAASSAPSSASHSARALGCPQREDQKHDMLRDGATGTGHPPGELTSQGCFIAEYETHLFSDASQI